MIDKCPHCGAGPYNDWDILRIGERQIQPNTTYQPEDKNKNKYDLLWQFCQNCDEFVGVIRKSDNKSRESASFEQFARVTAAIFGGGRGGRYSVSDRPGVSHTLAYPRRHRSHDLPQEVSEPFRSLYERAVAVMADDPGLAAVSLGRLIEALLKQQVPGAPQQGTLGALLRHADVQKHLNSLDPALAGALMNPGTLARNLGGHANFDLQTGDLIELDQTEAEYVLCLVDQLLDLSIVRPTKNAVAASTLLQKGKARRR